jgi:hypothetical protein
MVSTSAQALTLSCIIESQGDQGNFGAGFMRKSTVNKFSPKNQVHILNLKEKTAFYKGPNFKAKLDVLNDKRIRWKYVRTFTNKEKTVTHTITFEYIYLRINNKIVATVDFGPAYMKIVSTRAHCVES